MLKTPGYATHGPEAALEPFTFERREPGPTDVLIDILYCGVCHSDIHQARNEWENSEYPMVPGHEIVGRVSQVGNQVTKFSVGDIAGVGCMVDSCRTCENCTSGFEQCCDNHTSFTYNSTEQDETTRTHGGYSTRIVVDERFTLRIPANLPPEGVAPLLCAGVTTYSPLRRWGAGPGKRVGVIGLGGLGHMAVKIAAAMGCEVTVFSTSPSKEKDAKALGAHAFVVSTDAANLEPHANRFHILIDAVSAAHDINPYLELLGREGTLVLVGLPDQPLSVEPFSVISNQRALAGSSIGGIPVTQEMLDFCGEHGIVSDVEVIPIQSINEAYERTIRGDVRYRFVIDASTIG